MRVTELTVHPKPSTRRWSRYLRWSVRGLIVLVLLFAAV